jgi:thiamine pyrophosphate-dependent acetolactate synthase large subunit-like protein
MKRKVAELIAAKLAGHGCRHVFAISGAGNLHLFDAVVEVADTRLSNELEVL